MRSTILAGLIVWVGLVVCIGGFLLVHHFVALPAPPPTDTQLRDAVAALPGDAGRWRAVHVMYRSCRCSARTIAHLRASERPGWIDETVVLVDDDGMGDPADGVIAAAGFRLVVVTPRELHERFHVEAAPMLIVARPDRELAYVGGYNRHKQAATYEDLAIMDDLYRAEERGALPIFGCATSERLADALDPLGLKAW